MQNFITADEVVRSA